MPLLLTNAAARAEQNSALAALSLDTSAGSTCSPRQGFEGDAAKPAPDVRPGHQLTAFIEDSLHAASDVRPPREGVLRLAELELSLSPPELFEAAAELAELTVQRNEDIAVDGWWWTVSTLSGNAFLASVGEHFHITRHIADLTPTHRKDENLLFQLLRWQNEMAWCRFRIDEDNELFLGYIRPFEDLDVSEACNALPEMSRAVDSYLPPLEEYVNLPRGGAGFAEDVPVDTSHAPLGGVGPPHKHVLARTLSILSTRCRKRESGPTPPRPAQLRLPVVTVIVAIGVRAVTLNGRRHGMISLPPCLTRMIIQSHVLQGDARRDTGVDQSESLPRPRLRRTRRPAGPRQLGCAPCGRLTCSSSGNSTASAAMMEHRSGPQVRTIGGYVNRKGPAGFSGEDRDHGPALSPRRIGSNRPAGERTRSTTPGWRYSATSPGWVREVNAAVGLRTLGSPWRSPRVGSCYIPCAIAARIPTDFAGRFGPPPGFGGRRPNRWSSRP